MSELKINRLRLNAILITIAGGAAILISERFLDQPSDPLRWDAATVWTVVAIGSLALWSAMFRRSWRFWLFLCAALAAHVSAMWYLFGVLLPKALIGTIWVSGLGLVEGLFLYILFLWLAPARDKRRPRVRSKPRPTPHTPAD